MKNAHSQFRLRLPPPLKAWIEKEAEANYSTINAAITSMLLLHQRQVEKDRATERRNKRNSVSTN